MPSRTPAQRRFDESVRRFNLALWGRQSGKTTSGYRKLIWKPLQTVSQRPKNHWAVYWHVLQTYASADVVFDRYQRMIHPYKSQILRYKNESERRIDLIGRNSIFFKSGDNFEDLRTESLAGCVIDEARQQKKELWSTVVFPMLAKARKMNPQLGWADILSSTNGFDWLYDLKKEKENDPSWGIITAPSWEAWWWPQEEVNEAKKNMSDLEFRQEIGAEFVNMRSGKVYHAFTDQNLRTTSPWFDDKIFSPYHPILLGLDFNVTPMHWTLGQEVNKFFYWFDEIHMENTNTSEAAKELAQKLLVLRDQGHRPADFDILLLGDASGNARSTKSNESDYEIIKQTLKAYGIRFRNLTPLANPSIKDRVNAVNARFKAASGDISMWVHPINCKKLVHDLERVVWKAGADFTLDPGRKKDLTHASDSIGYPVAELAPVKVISGRATMKVIPRSV